MGKNDDFAACLTRIKEKSDRPEPTRGMLFDPRRNRRAEQRPSSLANKIGLMFSAGKIPAAGTALTFTVLSLMPVGETGAAPLAQTAPETVFRHAVHSDPLMIVASHQPFAGRDHTTDALARSMGRLHAPEGK